MTQFLRLVYCTLFIFVFAEEMVYAQPAKIDTRYYDNECGSGYFALYGIIFAKNGCQSLYLESDGGDGSPRKDTTYFAGAGAYCTPQAWQSHFYQAPGVYRIKHVLLLDTINTAPPLYWKRIDSVVDVVRVQCDGVMGRLFHDGNNDCTFNNQEHPILGTATLQVDSAGIPIDTINAYAFWNYKVLATTPTTYSFKVLKAPVGYKLTCPASGVINHLFYPDSAVAVEEFAFQCALPATTDYLLQIIRAFRGSASTGPSYIDLLASNTSCTSGPATVVLTVSPKYNITAAGISPTPASVAGHTITWNIANLSDGYYTYLHVPLTPLPTTKLGDTTCTYAIITPMAGDGDPSNNIISMCDSVRSSWDPNEMSVLPEGQVNPGTLLTYTTDFENDGNDTAFSIHVVDTLSASLDPGTFHLIGATHPVVPYVYQTDSGLNILKFDFEDIKLAGKSLPTRNKGQVRFSINLKSSLAAGTIIRNRAGIYFDYNPVVLTNYAYNRIPGTTSVSFLRDSVGIQVYPNPVLKQLNIDVEDASWRRVELLNAMGQIIIQKDLSLGNNPLNVENLAPGVYYLHLQGERNSRTEKLIKQ